MGARPAVRFEPLRDEHIPLLYDWLNRPHVARWWGGPQDAADVARLYREKIASDVVFPFVALLDGAPLGYIQSYDATRAGGGWWPDAAPSTWGVDAFIGEPELLGRGHGTALLRAFCDGLLDRPEVARVIADPHPDNARAVRAYEKAGFACTGEVATPGGRALLMVKESHRAARGGRDKADFR